METAGEGVGEGKGGGAFEKSTVFCIIFCSELEPEFGKGM